MPEIIEQPNVTVIEQVRTLRIMDEVGEIEREAREKAARLDISTAASRKEIASLAFAIAKRKNDLDRHGKALVAGIKDQAKAIDQERARAWNALEALQHEIRKPLTDWEEAEKARVFGHEAAIAKINQIATVPLRESSGAIAERIAALESFQRDWQEFAVRAERTKSDALDRLRKLHASQTAYEAEQAELARLRAEAAAREQAERDERLRVEAANKARQEAEAKAQRAAAEQAAKVEAERQAAAAREQQIRREKESAEARAKQAEEARLAAIKKAEADKKAAEEAKLLAEQQRLAALAKAEADRIAAKKEADERLKRLEKQRAEEAAQAEKDRVAAAERAEARRKQAVEEALASERYRAQAEERAKAKREADKKHRDKIHAEVAASIAATLVGRGIAPDEAHDLAAQLVEDIDTAHIPHLWIEY